ncbi:MAG: hypothetical protein ACE5KF_03710 [Kiloniellaceae bacterium]
MTGPDQITELLGITGRLTAVLEREVEMLRAMEPAAMQALQQDKMALAAAYESQLKKLKHDPGPLDALTPERGAELRTAIEAFRKTLAKSEHALRAAKETIDRVLRAIAEELKRKIHAAPSYSAGGLAPSGDRSASGEPVSLSFNQSV